MTDQHLSSRNRRTLSRIFQHPLAMNLSWRDVIHLFESHWSWHGERCYESQTTQ